MWYARDSALKTFDLLRKKIWGIYETDNPTKEQIEKYKRCEKELDNDSNSDFRYAHINFQKTVKIRIWKKSLYKIKVFKVCCQRNIAHIVKTCKFIA